MRTGHVMIVVLLIAAGFVAGGLVLGGFVETGSFDGPTRAQLAIACVLGGILVGGVVGAIGQLVQISREKRP